MHQDREIKNCGNCDWGEYEDEDTRTTEGIPCVIRKFLCTYYMNGGIGWADKCRHWVERIDES